MKAVDRSLRFGEQRAVDGSLEPDEGELRVIRMMVDMRERGMANNAIATKLKELGIATKRGGSWSATTVANILSRVSRSGGKRT